MSVRAINLKDLRTTPSNVYSRRLEGFVIGAGWNTAGAESDSWYKGRIELSSGAITNDFEGGVVVLGVFLIVKRKIPAVLYPKSYKKAPSLVYDLGK